MRAVLGDLVVNVVSVCVVVLCVLVVFVCDYEGN